MASIQPLRLKREVARKSTVTPSASLPIAQVWVDAGIYHCDGYFDYLIPEEISELISVGSKVVVPFHGREVEALVCARMSQSTQSGLKAISKAITRFPVANQLTLEIIHSVSQRWAAHPYDVIRSAIPPRVAGVERNFSLATQRSPMPRTRNGIREFKELPPFRDPFTLIALEAIKAQTRGSVLVLLPDTRSVSRFVDALIDSNPIILDSDLDRDARYLNFLTALSAENAIIVGTRGAIFAPTPDVATIFIYDETSEHYYEKRSPGWNVRDVALIRAAQTGCDLVFFGFSMSTEIGRAIVNGEIRYRAIKSKIAVATFQKEHGELLPDRIVAPIRKALKNGPVLFISPTKGYAQAISCAQCRNVALCPCGGKLSQPTERSAIQCQHCGKAFQQWRCSFCQSQRTFLLGRGAERFAFEIGSAFPGNSIVQSTAEHPVENFELESGIVIATPGMAPRRADGYSAVVILEGDRLLTQADLRSDERVRTLFFESASYLNAKGTLLLVLNHHAPIISALSAWKPEIEVRRALSEREEVALPPFTRAATLDLGAGEISSLFRGLVKSKEDGRLPDSSRFLGPTDIGRGISRILILVKVEDGDALVEFLHEFQRRRSASKKELATLRIDPYSLSR